MVINGQLNPIDLVNPGRLEFAAAVDHVESGITRGLRRSIDIHIASRVAYIVPAPYWSQ